SVRPENRGRAEKSVSREFAGRPIDEVREAIVARLQEARGIYDTLMARAFAMASRALDAQSAGHALHVDGTSSLLGDASHLHAELSLDTLRALVEMIEEEQRLDVRQSR